MVPYLTYWFPARARWSRPSGVLVAFWPLPTALLSPAVAATGIAMINSLGNLGGFSGPYAVGFLQDRTGSFLPGLVLLSFLAGLGGLVAILVTRRPH